MVSASTTTRPAHFVFLSRKIYSVPFATITGRLHEHACSASFAQFYSMYSTVRAMRIR